MVFALGTCTLHTQLVDLHTLLLCECVGIQDAGAGRSLRRAETSLRGQISLGAALPRSVPGSQWGRLPPDWPADGCDRLSRSRQWRLSCRPSVFVARCQESPF